MSESAFVEVRGATVAYGGVLALDDVDIALAKGRTLAIVGPSGCGKSTLLRSIAGLQVLDAGSVVLAGRDLAEVATFCRGIGLMFQDHALFPHLDVAANVGFGLRMQRVSKPQRHERVAEMLHLTGLESKAASPVQSLSGGEQQRVALARTLAPEPRLVLLDEPMGSLDRALRERLAEDVATVFAAVEATALFVTHDQTEAAVIGHEVAVMRAGKILQLGSAKELWRSPVDEWTARFLGQTNLIDGSFVGSSAPRVMVRPEKLRLAAAGTVQLSGVVVSAHFVAGEWRVRVQTEAGELLVLAPGEAVEPTGRLGVELLDGAIVPFIPPKPLGGVAPSDMR